MHLMTEKRYSSDMRFEKVKYHKFLKSDQFRLTELNTPASHELAPVLLLVVRQRPINFPSRRRGIGVAE
jgi:hypothetical protein